MFKRILVPMAAAAAMAAPAQAADTSRDGVYAGQSSNVAQVKVQMSVAGGRIAKLSFTKVRFKCGDSSAATWKQRSFRTSIAIGASGSFAKSQSIRPQGGRLTDTVSGSFSGRKASGTYRFTGVDPFGTRCASAKIRWSASR